MDAKITGENRSGKERYLSPIHVWALPFGCAVGWGSFIMPGTTFLPKAGPVGTALGLIIGAVVMFIIGVNYCYLMDKFKDAGGTLMSFQHTTGITLSGRMILTGQSVERLTSKLERTRKMPKRRM